MAHKAGYNDLQTNPSRMVLFTLDGQRYALRLDTVERVIRAVAITPVPETPDFILGLINLAGQLLPVVSLRRCLGLPERPVQPENHFVIVQTSRLTLVLVVDEVQALTSPMNGPTIRAEDVLPGPGCRLHGLVKLDGDIILIYDLDDLFGQDDRKLMREVSTRSPKP